MSANELQNIDVVRRGYEAFAKGDIETLKTLFSASANWRQTEAGVQAGEETVWAAIDCRKAENGVSLPHE